MLYTIGEMAKKMNLPTSTLRFYERKGLLPFIERSSGGVRMFTSSDYELLLIIECLKESGMSLKDIDSFIQMSLKGDETIDERLELFQIRKKEVENQIENLQKILKILEYKCWYYETAKEAGTVSIHENIDNIDVPKQYRSIKKNLKDQ